MSEPTKYRPRGYSAARLQRERDIANAVHKACDERDTRIKDLDFQLAKAKQEVEYLSSLLKERDGEVAELDKIVAILRRHLRNAFRAAAFEFKNDHPLSPGQRAWRNSDEG